MVNPTGASSYEDFVDGALFVDERGRVVEAGLWQALARKYKEIAAVFDLGERLILPGLVDLHIHLPQVTQIGKSGDTLLGWLEKYIFPAESLFSDVAHARKIASWFFDELARNGTTLANVFTTIHSPATDAAFEVAAQKGSRIIMGKVMMDRNSPPALTENLSDSVNQSSALAERWHGHDDGRLLYAFIPRFAITSTNELLHETGKAWKKHPGTYMHTHLSESEEEVSVVAELYPESRSYLDVYDRAGLVGDLSVFAHSIHLDDEDLSILAQRKSALAYCPGSNFFLKSGVFKFDLVKAAKVPFGLGSDVAAGPCMCLFGVMKDANFIQPNIWIPPAELLYHATLGGAKALKLDHKVGNFRAGKEADFIIVNPTNRTAVPKDILKHPTEEILSVLTFMGDDRMVDATFIRGRAVFQKEELQPASHEQSNTLTA